MIMTNRPADSVEGEQGRVKTFLITDIATNIIKSMGNMVELKRQLLF